MADASYTPLSIHAAPSPIPPSSHVVQDIKSNWGKYGSVHGPRYLVIHGELRSKRQYKFKQCRKSRGCICKDHSFHDNCLGQTDSSKGLCKYCNE